MGMWIFSESCLPIALFPCVSQNTFSFSFRSNNITFPDEAVSAEITCPIAGGLEGVIRMSEELRNKTEVMSLNPGDLFLARNNKEYIFVSFTKGIIIGKLGDKGYKIPLQSYVRLVRRGADLELAKKYEEKDALKAAKKEANKGVLKTLGLGDIVRCNDGQLYSFIKLNKTKFRGKLGDILYEIPIAMFVELVEKAKADPELEAKKAKIRPYFKREIQTSWGPAIV
jgi:hypothetical protein